MKLLKKIAKKKIEAKERKNGFVKKWQEIKMRTFIDYTYQNEHRRKVVLNLFVNKFCPFMIHKTREDVFSRIKNYGNNQIILKKTDRTDRIQTLIETFEKKRKAILSFNMVKWRRNQY